MITEDHKCFNRYQPLRENLLEFIHNELEGKSQDTKTSYFYSLELFFEFLINQYPDTFPAYTEKEINSFLFSLHKKSASYLNRIYAAIQNYSAFTGQVLNKNKIALPKQDNYKQIQPRSLSNEETEKIENHLYLAYIKQKQKNNKNRSSLPSTSKERDTLRNYVFYRLMVQTSLRISEAIALDIDDLFLEGKRKESRYIFVRGKGNKNRKIPISIDLKELLIYYIQFRKEYDLQIEFEKVYFQFINKRLNVEHKKGIEAAFLESENEILNESSSVILRYVEKTFIPNLALFVSNRGKRVSKDTMMKMFQSHGIQSHELRHTAIKTLVDEGVPFNKIQSISGHSSADMVLRYSKPTFEEIQKEIDHHQRTFNRTF